MTIWCSAFASLLAAVMGPHLAAKQTETLRQVLERYRVPVDSTALMDPGRTITSYAVEDAPDLFTIGFYLVGPNPRVLSDTLRVSTYDRVAGTWRHANDAQGTGGSVTRIAHDDRHILLDTHINPSAGSLPVWSRDLRIVARLEGWLLRLLPSGDLMYHKSMLHFAPTHPAEVWTWHRATGRDAPLYPTGPPGPIRARYIQMTRAHYARLGEQWFREHNHHIDPERFSSSLGDTIVVDDTGTRVAFVVRFGGHDSPADPPPLEVGVMCRDVTTIQPACDESDLAEMRARHPAWATPRLLTELLKRR